MEFSASRPKKSMTKALPKVSAVESRNAISSLSPKTFAMAKHHDMKNASMKSSEPMIFQMRRQFTIGFAS